jgi:hypothetical protein
MYFANSDISYNRTKRVATVSYLVPVNSPALAKLANLPASDKTTFGEFSPKHMSINVEHTVGFADISRAKIVAKTDGLSPTTALVVSFADRVSGEVLSFGADLKDERALSDAVALVMAVAGCHTAARASRGDELDKPARSV